jgi:hypothetical protein
MNKSKSKASHLDYTVYVRSATTAAACSCTCWMLLQVAVMSPVQQRPSSNTLM